MSATPTGTARPALLLLCATLLAGTGNGISLVAFPWLVLAGSGDALDASVVAASAAVPLVASTLLAGAAVDMLGRRPVALLSDVLSGVSVAAVPTLAWLLGADALGTGVFALLAALGAVFDPAGFTARESMLPEAALRAGWSLDRMNSVYEAVVNLCYVVGPGVGGLLIAEVGGVSALWVAAAVFALSVAATAAVHVDGAARPSAADRPRAVIAGVVEALRFVWGIPVLRTLALMEMAVTALYLPMEAVLFPLYFTERDAPAQLGWALMAFAGGGVVGALASSWLVRRVTRRRIALVAVGTFGAATLGIAALPPLPAVLTLCAVIGLMYGPMGPLYNHAMQSRAPQRLRGRVVGVMTSLTYAAGPVGYLVAGPLADAAGLRVTFLLLGVPVLLIAAVAARLPSLHALDREADAAPPD